jgi:hypothetical protein
MTEAEGDLRPPSGDRVAARALCLAAIATLGGVAYDLQTHATSMDQAEPFAAFAFFVHVDKHTAALPQAPCGCRVRAPVRTHGPDHRRVLAA